MASHFGQLNLNREYGIRTGDDDDVLKNDISGNTVINLTIKQLRQVFHKSLDLNRPVLDTIMSEENNLSNTYSEKVENAESKLPEEIKASEDDKEKTASEDHDNGKTPTDLDLNLSLSISAADSPKQDSSSNPPEPLSPSSPSTDQRSCMSLDLNTDSPDDEEKKKKDDADADDDDDDDGIPSLVLMGCSRCMMYVMVSEAEPRCPKCMTTVLIDQFRGNQAKRARKN